MFLHMYVISTIIPLPATKKMHLKMSSFEIVCCIKISKSMTNFHIQTNSVEPDETAPIGAVSSGSTLFAIKTF